MEKLMYLLWKPTAEGETRFRDALLEKLVPALPTKAAQRIRINVIDTAVAPAKKLYLHHLTPAPAAVVSFWLDSAIHRQGCEQELGQHSERYCGYLVTESEPLRNIRYPALPGQRTHGMNQVVLLRRPASLSFAEWIHIWHDRHTQIAIDTQSTFGYRQNVVTRALTENAEVIDAIVEENFPPEAMTSAHAFYNAIGDDALLKQNQQRMFESIKRFVDLGRLDCLPMSEYNF